MYYGGDWVPKIRVPKGNTRTRTKFWVWVGLGLCLNSMGIFGLGTHKVQNFCLRFSDFYLESFSAFSANFFAVKTGFRNKIKSSADIHDGT